MNKRIKELAQQTDVWCDQNHHGDKFYDIRWEEKFAELIVRECAKEAFNFWCYQDDCNDESAQSHIKKHFGIEK